jgi:hypothetical protein
VDKHRFTQVGRTLQELGGQMIPAYSPQARGRSERNFGTWQGRLTQELRLAGIATLDAANAFLRARRIAEFNRKLTVPAAEKGIAFRRTARGDLNGIFSVQTERVVNKDNTVAIGNLAKNAGCPLFRRCGSDCPGPKEEETKNGKPKGINGSHVLFRTDHVLIKADNLTCCRQLPATAASGPSPSHLGINRQFGERAESAQDALVFNSATCWQPAPVTARPDLVLNCEGL